MVVYCVIGLIFAMTLAIIDFILCPEEISWIGFINELKTKSRIITLIIVTVMYSLLWPIILITNVVSIVRMVLKHKESE